MQLTYFHNFTVILAKTNIHGGTGWKCILEDDAVVWFRAHQTRRKSQSRNQTRLSLRTNRKTRVNNQIMRTTCTFRFHALLKYLKSSKLNLLPQVVEAEELHRKNRHFCSNILAETSEFKNQSWSFERNAKNRKKLRNYMY